MIVRGRQSSTDGVDGASVADCTITLQPQEHTLIVQLAGVLDAANAAAVSDALARLIEPDHRPLLLLDLERLVADGPGADALRAVVEADIERGRRYLSIPDDAFTAALLGADRLPVETT